MNNRNVSGNNAGARPSNNINIMTTQWLSGSDDSSSFSPGAVVVARIGTFKRNRIDKGVVPEYASLASVLHALHDLKAGAEVIALREGSSGWVWVAAVILGDNRDGTYAVLFDDGTDDLACKRTNIKAKNISDILSEKLIEKVLQWLRNYYLARMGEWDQKTNLETYSDLGVQRLHGFCTRSKSLAHETFCETFISENCGNVTALFVVKKCRKKMRWSLPCA